MSKWLQSGRRRDMCVLLSAAEDGELRGQQLKSRLESHYDGRIDPKSFYGSLSALVEAGFVEERTEGIHDVYRLTDEGERRVQDHYEWLRGCLESDASSETVDS
ncbi:PadR family transcriptional regulator [Halopiger aswanensis]|uniref:PadR family transcriptional regulator n=1 Tax=Halopiger aswanensis TaxID=148449 RepID=A0A419WQR6_9EURY|nr:PadR family transcriptional regulator [Halopiger aswanensis]RKD97764.1 PadR family transcriptional regulator [Halopiger aswanensis]